MEIKESAEGIGNIIEPNDWIKIFLVIVLALGSQYMAIKYNLPTLW